MINGWNLPSDGPRKAAFNLTMLGSVSEVSLSSCSSRIVLTLSYNFFVNPFLFLITKVILPDSGKLATAKGWCWKKSTFLTFK